MTSKPEQKTILIIEDEPTIMTFASRLLEIRGHRTLQAEDGIDGWGILEQMRKEPRLMKIPVIVFSAFAEPTKINTAKEWGVAEYLIKPLSASKLTNTVEAVLERYKGV